jgi:predicted nucleic acid-binding protein
MADDQIFLDTNILVYAHDVDAGKKRDRAVEKVRDLWNRALPPAISAQVLQEFYVNLVRKGVAVETARETVSNYLEWDVVDNDRLLFQDAMRIKERWKVSLWDASILAAAQRAKASILWSEDFNADQNYDGIQVINPLN